MKRTGKRMRRPLALLVVTALFAGILSMGNATVSKAAEKSDRAGYGLNNPRTDAGGVTTWDCVWFGNYWQEDTNGDGKADQNDTKTPIKWRVLSVDGDDAFLLADKNLDCRKYNETWTDVTWETSTMRDWLNGDFLDTAFSESEQSAIRTTNVVNNGNSRYGTEGGNHTLDKVYLLSIDEVTNPAYGFSSNYSVGDWARWAKNTEYVKAQGAYTCGGDYNNGNGSWWLRSPGHDSTYASGVDHGGFVNRSGCYVDYDADAARAALHLNLLSTSSWSYAGTVTERGVSKEVTPAPGASAQPTLSCDISTEKPATPQPNPNTDSMALFEDCGGNIESKGIADYLISDWSFKSPTFPVTIKKDQKDDGGYTIKATIGIGRKDILDQETTWNQYKSCVKKVKSKNANVSELNGLIDTFGGERGTFSVTEKMKAKPTLAFAGYYEIVCDKNNNIISQEGGGTATASWSAKKSWQSVVMAGPVPIPLYFDLTGKIDLEGELGISFASLDDRTVTGSLTLKPSVALGGGLGVSGVASVGVEGKLGFAAQLIPASKGSYSASLALKAYIAFVLDWTYQLPGAELEGTIWDTTNRSRSRGLFSAPAAASAGNTPSLSLADRSYSKKTTDWYGSGKPMRKARAARGAGEYSSVSVSPLQEYIMPNTIPAVQRVGEKTVMVFQANVKERSAADSSCLMYSVLEDGIWSEPKAVWDTGTCDLFADMKVIDGTLYLVWQKEKAKIAENEDASGILDEMEKNSEICMAVFDDVAGEFVQTQYITDDEETDMMPALAGNDLEVSVVWVQNTAGSFFGEAGENRVMSVKLQGDSVSEPVQLGATEEYVNELAAGYVGEELEAAVVTTKVSVEGEETSAGVPNVSVFTAEGEKRLSSAAEYAGGVQYFDGKLYYLQDTFIYEYNRATGETLRISAGEVLSQGPEDGGEDGQKPLETSVFGSSFRIYGQQGKTVIIWNEGTDTGSAVRSSVKTEEGFSAPVTLFETENGKTIQNFHAVLLEDGNWQFVVNTRNAAEDKSSIEYVSKKSEPKIRVDYIQADEGERVNAIQPVRISLTNESEETVTEFTVRVYTEEKVYAEKTVECSILPGETFLVEEEVDLTELAGQADLNVRVLADGQKESNDSVASAPVGRTDLSLKLEKQVDADQKSVTFSACVTNESESETTGHIALYNKGTGELIESREAGVLAPGQKKTLDFVIGADDVKSSGADAVYYKVVAESSREEYNAENNTDYGVVYADEVGLAGSTAQPSGTATPTPTGTAVPSAPTPTSSPAEPLGTPGKTMSPGINPTATPATIPTATPDAGQTLAPAPTAGATPTNKPDTSPTVTPGATMKPTITPSVTTSPDATPTASPVSTPTAVPTSVPGTTPTAAPTTAPGSAVLLPSVSLPQLIAPVTQPPVLPAPADIGKISSVKLKQKKQAVTISWKKVSGAAGYQICYSTSKKWKGKKQKLTRNNKLTVKKLKKKKTYYFRVRAYRINGTGKLYGAWSETKKIKIKK